MTLCILCINCFQGYWLWTTYQQEQQVLQKDVNEALRQALEDRQAEDIQVKFFVNTDSSGTIPANKMLHYRVDERSQSQRVTIQEAFVPAPADTLSFEVFATHDVEEVHGLPDISAHTVPAKALGKDLKFDILQDPATAFVDSVPVGTYTVPSMAQGLRPSNVQLGTMRVQADTMARKISTMILSNSFFNGQDEMARIDSLYRLQLESRGVDLNFRLDTLRRSLAVGPPADTTQGAALHTTWRPMNILSHLFVRAHFDHPGWVVQKRMVGLFAGSLILLLLTTWCFIYMLQTILSQRKLAEIKNDFINNMAHELRTPMATVSAAIEAIQHFKALEDRDKTLDYLQIAGGEVQRLNGLVDRVLSMAIEEHRDMLIQVEATDVPALIETLFNNQRLRSSKAASFSLDNQLDDPIVQLDPLHMGNAISNLLDNALKYADPGVDIRVSCREAEGGILLSVQDTGWGIDPAYQTQVFERFFRVPQGELHEVKGFGLGLAYVKKVILKHGGWIRLSSQVEQGTTFNLFLPRL